MAKNGGKISPETEFKKGESGNPNGRPKGVPNAATRMKRFLELEINGKNPITKEDEQFTVAELMDLKIIAKAMNGDLSAWEKINDRLEGKPRQSHDLTSGGEPISVNPLEKLPIEDQADILRKINKANAVK